VSGIDGYRSIDEAGGVQWPCPEGTEIAVGAERRLFADGRFLHPDGRARFVFDEPRRVPEPPSPSFPLVLLTGRGSSSQWHTQTRTAKSAVLRALSPADPYVELAPADAAPRGIDEGDWVEVESAHGSVQVRARVTPVVQPGQVFVPMHDAATNRLTRSVFDPHSRQPSYKSGAVEVRRTARRRS
jgi:assimilatory nitrate reductase catalytic subunit